MSNMQVPYGDTRFGDGINQAHVMNLGFVGQGSSIPSRFSANEIKSSISDISQGKIHLDSIGNTVKQEPSMDFMDNTAKQIPLYNILQLSLFNSLVPLG